MQYENSSGQELGRQPLLPQMRLIWSFVAVTASAVLITLVRFADQGAAMVAALISVLIWLAVLFGAFSVLFAITYALGLLEALVVPPEQPVLSPFANDRLPDQIVAPIKSDAQ
jgi:hypothetical protein